jgi:hypothetical protein
MQVNGQVPDLQTNARSIKEDVETRLGHGEGLVGDRQGMGAAIDDYLILPEIIAMVLQSDGVAIIQDLNLLGAGGTREEDALNVVDEDGESGRLLGVLGQDVGALTLVIKLLTVEVKVVRVSIAPTLTDF